jgi:hypothetical protein
MSRRGFVVALLVMLALVPSRAFAYLDGGSSSMLFQAAAAALFTLLFVLRAWWARIRTFFRKRGASRPPGPDPGGAPPPGQDR